MTTFKGCTALITGASSGLGAEFARQLAPHARCLILVARRRERIEELAGEIARHGLTVRCFAVDLAKTEAREAFLKDLAGIEEKVTLLINNAGLGDHGLFESADWQRVKAMLDVNITALTYMTHALLPDLIRAKNAAILNVSSIAGLLPLPHMAVYAASKAYLNSFTEALRIELRGTGVSVTALCPGPFDTEFASRAHRPEAGTDLPAPEIFKTPVPQVVREGLGAVIRDRPRVIPGIFVAMVMTITAVVPLFLLRFFLAYRDRKYKGH